VFSQVRRAFLLIKLKEQQIATRQELLQQFEKQYEVKQQRLEAGNLSVKIDVLTARLNVLTERTRINTLSRERFNRTMELLRLIGMPVGADQVKLVGKMDGFGLGQFDLEPMVRLALAQSSAWRWRKPSSRKEPARSTRSDSSTGPIFGSPAVTRIATAARAPQSPIRTTRGVSMSSASPACPTPATREDGDWDCSAISLLADLIRAGLPMQLRS
jgi:hypothetical protein